MGELNGVGDPSGESEDELKKTYNKPEETDERIVEAGIYGIAKVVRTFRQCIRPPVVQALERV